MGNPFGGCTRSSLFHHTVDLFESEPLTFRHEEVGIYETADAEGAPQPEDVGTQVALIGSDKIRSDDGDNLLIVSQSMLVSKGDWGISLKYMLNGVTYAIPQPVRGCRKTDTTGTHWKRKDFANYDPCTGAPGAGEEENINTYKRDHRFDHLGVVTSGDTHDRNDKLANKHTDSTPNEQGSTTEFFDGPEGDWSRAHVDKGSNESDEERIVDGAESLEECRSKIKDKVDASPLLHHLQGGSQDGTAQVTGRFRQAATEAIKPRIEVASLRNDLEFVFMVCYDFSQLLLNVIRIRRIAS